MRQVFACPLHPLRSPQREAALSSMRGQSEEVVARKPRVRSARPRRLQRHWPRAARLLLLALGIALASAAGLAPTALGADSVYWTNIAGVRVADLDGTGTPVDLFADGGAPQGVALDPAAGKIYWASLLDGTIRVANLDGTGSPTSLFTGENFPLGVAIDPAAGKIYWTDSASSANHAGAIRVANLDGTGSPVSLFTGETDPRYLAVLRAPSGTSAPTVSGGGKAAQQLSCTEGGWAADVLGAFLYRAPASFAYRWQRDGSDIAGADQQTYTPPAAGSYTCRVTA